MITLRLKWSREFNNPEWDDCDIVLIKDKVAGTNFAASRVDGTVLWEKVSPAVGYSPNAIVGKLGNFLVATREDKVSMQGGRNGVWIVDTDTGSSMVPDTRPDGLLNRIKYYFTADDFGCPVYVINGMIFMSRGKVIGIENDTPTVLPVEYPIDINRQAYNKEENDFRRLSSLLSRNDNVNISDDTSLYVENIEGEGGYSRHRASVRLRLSLRDNHDKIVWSNIFNKCLGNVHVNEYRLMVGKNLCFIITPKGDEYTVVDERLREQPCQYELSVTDLSSGEILFAEELFKNPASNCRMQDLDDNSLLIVHYSENRKKVTACYFEYDYPS